AVASKRGLKSTTVWEHLAQAVGHGLVQVEAVVDLPSELVARTRKVCHEHATQGILQVTPVHQALEGEVDFERLRVFMAEAKAAGLVGKTGT
ncbi:MAG: helix-turn-helix domain-containing protein, partial [Proteobacteria bacterium]|nr:helix-turn-helix domain-containing protein [Pseudomonadota bacterium]